MSSSTYKVNHMGTALMQFSGTVPAGQHYRLVSVTCHFSAAPTSSEDMTVTLDAHAGAAYDTRLYTIDPAAHALTDLVWMPDEEIILEGGDQVDVAYDNTDVRLYGAQITFKAV
jgi:hypothetical protein